MSTAPTWPSRATPLRPSTAGPQRRRLLYWYRAGTCAAFGQRCLLGRGHKSLSGQGNLSLNLSPWSRAQHPSFSQFFPSPLPPSHLSSLSSSPLDSTSPLLHFLPAKVSFSFPPRVVVGAPAKVVVCCRRTLSNESHPLGLATHSPISRSVLSEFASW